MNITDAIEIPRTLATEILAHAQQGDDKEICGLVSVSQEPEEEHYHCHPIPNTATDPQHRYDMEPESLIEAMREIRQHGRELFAIYHSHPSSPALPSVTDLNEANYKDVIYLIISLNTKGVLEIRAFRLADNDADELQLIVSEE